VNVLELKSRYLKYMGEHAPIWAPRRPPKLTDYPSAFCFAHNGSSNWFTRRLTRDPWSNEAFSQCARCLRHNVTPDDVNLPFYWVLLGLGWNMFNRRKAIRDNFGFLKEIGLDPSKLKATVWKGGRILGVGIDHSSDPGESFAGKDFDTFLREGLEIPRDVESISAWKECGLNDSQIVELGEGEKLDPSGSGVVHLEGADDFVGIRNGIHYEAGGRYLEIGMTVADAFVKRSSADKAQVAQAALEGDVDSEAFLVRLKAKTIVGGFGVERLAMAVNGNKSVFDVEPYRELATMLAQNGAEDKVAWKAASRIPAVVWLVNDGGNATAGNSKARQAIYRSVLGNVVQDLSASGLDGDDIYLSLFKTVTQFYSQDDDFKSIAGLETVCLDEIKKQKNRMRNKR